MCNGAGQLPQSGTEKQVPCTTGSAPQHARLEVGFRGSLPVDVVSQVADLRAGIDGLVHLQLGLSPSWQQAQQVHDAPVLAQVRCGSAQDGRESAGGGVPASHTCIARAWARQLAVLKAVAPMLVSGRVLFLSLSDKMSSQPNGPDVREAWARTALLQTAGLGCVAMSVLACAAASSCLPCVGLAHRPAYHHLESTAALAISGDSCSLLHARGAGCQGRGQHKRGTLLQLMHQGQQSCLRAPEHSARRADSAHMDVAACSGTSQPGQSH